MVIFESDELLHGNLRAQHYSLLVFQMLPPWSIFVAVLTLFVVVTATLTEASKESNFSIKSNSNDLTT